MDLSILPQAAGATGVGTLTWLFVKDLLWPGRSATHAKRKRERPCARKLHGFNGRLRAQNPRRYPKRGRAGPVRKHEPGNQ